MPTRTNRGSLGEWEDIKASACDWLRAQPWVAGAAFAAARRPSRRAPHYMQPNPTSVRGAGKSGFVWSAFPTWVLR
jgi:hypothetical protein